MTKWTTTDIPDQTGRTAVITGANTGLGYETATALAAKGAHVVLAVRNIEKGKDAARRIEQSAPRAHVAVQELDLTVAAHEAADPSGTRHHRLRLRAGVMFTPHSETRTASNYGSAQPFGHLRSPGCCSAACFGARLRVVTVSGVASVRRARNQLRRPSMGAQLQQGRRRSACWRTCCYGRTAAPPAGPNTARPPHTRQVADGVGHRLVRWSRRHAAGGTLFQPADMGALPTLRAATDPGVIGGSTTAPTVR
jgi:hypothetical protein